MHPLLQRVCNSFIRSGTLRVTSASGSTFTLGDGTGKPIGVRFTTRAAEFGVLLDPDLKFGEAYMNGTFVVEEGSIADVIALGMSQGGADKVPQWVRPQWLARRVWGRLQQLSGQGQRRKKVAHHYDLDGPFYSLFLDPDQQYSCAYFEAPDQSLEEAQLAKKRHIAAKLLVNPASRVLDIGCGWGGLAFYLAEICGAGATGVTLSELQVARANAQADQKGLGSRVEFRAEDYRHVTGVFDRIVAIEMIENIGVGSCDAFFRKCADLLAEDGVFLLHSSVRREGPEITSPFISKYVFPGSYIPALSELLPAIERAGLLVTDIEFLRLHYAETLKAWRERFLARREDIERLYDARFFRMWEFCLACSEMAFRRQGAVIVQIQLTKRQDVVPITRDYIAREEARLRGMEDDRTMLRVAGE
jgi:cyclopropane-fatty-acyl-phospholipid synthase